MDQKTPQDESKKEPSSSPEAASAEKPASSPPEKIGSSDQPQPAAGAETTSAKPGAEVSGPRKILDQLDNNPAQPPQTDKPVAAEPPSAKTESPAAETEKSAPDPQGSSENASGLVSEAMQRLDVLIQEYKKTDH